MWATAGSSLNEDLMAFARRVRISMQFGSDEDLSGCVGQCSNRPEICMGCCLQQRTLYTYYTEKHPRNSHSVCSYQMTCADPTRSLLGAVCSAEPKAEMKYK
jgi:hypothetical protein